jgi:hypothetical protein
MVPTNGLMLVLLRGKEETRDLEDSEAYKEIKEIQERQAKDLSMSGVVHTTAISKTQL